MDIPIGLFKPKSPLSAEVVENRALAGVEGLGESRHIVLQWDNASDLHWRTGQSIGVLPPGINPRGRAHPLRLYSIASASMNQPQIALCVKRVTWNDPQGQLQRGIASNFLCDLEVGDKVHLCGPLGKHFVFDQADTPWDIMVGAGTGVAPFMARIHEILQLDRQSQKKLWCIFGFRSQELVLYKEELKLLREKYGGRLRIDYVLSREQTNPDGSRMYCGDFVAQHPEIIQRVIQDQSASLYICGILGLEVKIDEAFEHYCVELGINWQDMKEKLCSEHRWIQEVY